MNWELVQRFPKFFTASSTIDAVSAPGHKAVVEFSAHAISTDVKLAIYVTN